MATRIGSQTVSGSQDVNLASTGDNWASVVLIASDSGVRIGTRGVERQTGFRLPVATPITLLLAPYTDLVAVLDGSSRLRGTEVAVSVAVTELPADALRLT